MGGFVMSTPLEDDKPGTVHDDGTITVWGFLGTRRVSNNCEVWLTPENAEKAISLGWHRSLLPEANGFVAVER